MSNRDNRPIGERASEAAQNTKEDIKGATRQAEGRLTGDKGQQREHDQSSLERAGQYVSDTAKGAAQYVSETADSAAKKVGLKSDDRRE